MDYRFFTLVLLLLWNTLSSQTSFCPDDPPLNPWLADSPYPVYHRNCYAQASTCITGILPGDSIRLKTRTGITGGTSPWIYLSDKYPGGERTILYSNSTHVFKFIDDGNTLVAIDSFRLDFNTVNSNGYNHLLSKNKIWFSYEPTYDPANNQYSRLFKFTDVNPANPYSKIRALDTFNFGDYGINQVNMYNLNHNGEIVWYSEEDVVNNIGYAGVIDQNFNLLDTLVFARLPNERIQHNSIAVDENNAFYIVTSHRLIQFVWDGVELVIGWQALYDFVHDGPTGNFAYGSGTTPTLIGWGDGNDKLVVVADGHANNNLVAFWRELPPGWTGIPGMPLHFADSISIPNAASFSNLFQSIENSPTARGYDIAIAQFNGFLGYDCVNSKGVSKFSWNPVTNALELKWTTDEVNFNGVLSYSAGSNLVYGTGKESDCNYYYYGLDWEDGSVDLRYLLGPEQNFPNDPFYDQGVNHIIDEEGSIYYSGSRSLIKLERVGPSVSVEDPYRKNDGIRVFPNPVGGPEAGSVLTVEGLAMDSGQYSLFTPSGILVAEGVLVDSSIDMTGLPTGVYFIFLENGNNRVIRKIVKI